MGISIRPCGRRRLPSSKRLSRYFGAPSFSQYSFRLYGYVPDYISYYEHGLSLIRIRSRGFSPSPFKYQYMYSRAYTKRRGEIPKYIPKPDRFPTDTTWDYTSYHRFYKVSIDMKLRCRLARYTNLRAISGVNRDVRSRSMNTNKHSLSDDSITASAVEHGVDVTDNMPNASSTIHHFTEEYYLSYLTKYYDFSLTHNDLCSIDKDHIPVLVDMITKYFDKYDDPKLKLRHIELIDHTIHMNELFLFSFSKVYVQARIFYSTDPKDAYVTEFVAFSKYPKSEDMDKMISELSSMIYSELLKRDLDTNARLVHPDKHPETSTQFSKLIAIGSNDVREEDISIKDSNLTNDYYPYLDIDMLTEDYLKSDDKLLILHGENGSGKTKLSNILGVYLYKNKFKVIVCGGADVTNPAILTEIETSIYSTINKASHICIIIDDIEPQLLNRSVNDETVNVFFNKLLLLLDGNFDAKLKVIITTNHVLKDDADEPLYRAGRMFDSIYIRYLKENEAKKILKDNGLTHSQIVKFVDGKGDSIKQSDVAQCIRMIKNNVNKRYRLDDTGSHIGTKRKKAGFIK